LNISYYRGSDALILVYDVTRKSTFQNLDKWKDNFFKQASIDSNKIDFPVIVLGNKVDLDSRQVSV